MPLIVLEGIDVSGKKTHTRILAKKLSTLGLNVKCLAFPDYNTVIGGMIKSFLQGKFKLQPEVLQLLYVANRWERKRDMDAWLRDGKTVIADRYIPSGLAYGHANNLDLKWMLNLEENLPNADIVIVIDISVDAALNREKPKDIYEKDKLFQERVRRSYLDLADQFNWTVIDGDGPVENVAEQVWMQVSKRLKTVSRI